LAGEKRKWCGNRKKDAEEREGPFWPKKDLLFLTLRAGKERPRDDRFPVEEEKGRAFLYREDDRLCRKGHWIRKGGKEGASFDDLETAKGGEPFVRLWTPRRAEHTCSERSPWWGGKKKKKVTIKEENLSSDQGRQGSLRL